MHYKLILGLVLICLIVIFSIQNVAIVEIKFFFWTVVMSRVLLIFILLVVGIVAGWLLNSFSVARKKLKD